MNSIDYMELLIKSASKIKSMKITKHLLPISKIKFDDFSLRIQNKTDKERFSVILLLKYFRYQPRELEHYSGSNAPGYKQDNEIIVTI